MSSPEKALYDLLVARLSPEQLRRLLAHHYGHALLAELPAGPVTHSQFAFEAAALLIRSDLAEPLLAALVAEQPEAYADVAAVAGRLEIALPGAPRAALIAVPNATSSSSAAPEPVSIILEFVRSQNAAQAHMFEFVSQTYAIRNAGGAFEQAQFPWTRAFLDDLLLARTPGVAANVLHRIGDMVRTFLANAGWNLHEQTILAAVSAGQPIHITIRSAAAELYAVPWELVTLRSTGQMLGSIPGLLLRYEWPDTASAGDRTPTKRRGRVLFAWSAAGGEVPAARHQAALTDAFKGIADGFDVARDVLPHATLADLHQTLDRAANRGEPIDALHLLCHGAAASGTYGLMLDESTPGNPVIVDPGRLQQVLARHAGMLRMIVVVACDSSNGGEPGNHVGSITQMLHRLGIPVVVGSRFPVSVTGSTQFAEHFYRSLVRERAPLESAFLAARDALALDPTHIDWLSIQLYARVNDWSASFPLTLPDPPAARSTLAASAARSSITPAGTPGIGKATLPASLVAGAEIREGLEELFNAIFEDEMQIRALLRCVEPSLNREARGPTTPPVDLVEDAVRLIVGRGLIDVALRCASRDPKARPALRLFAARFSMPFEEDASPDPAVQAQHATEIEPSTREVLNWDNKLPTGRRIPRPELAVVRAALDASEKPLIALLGEGGSGKSALMATLAALLQSEDIQVIGIRLDNLPKSAARAADLQDYLGLSLPLLQLAQTMAAEKRLVIIIDQFDALCDLMSTRGSRLTLLLETIDGLTRIPNTHVVLACRPFEFHYDGRVRRLDPTPIILQLPPWEQIEPCLREADIDPHRLAPQLKEELRQPQVLHTLLSLKLRRLETSSLTTYQAMRREMWQIHVSKAKNPKKRRAALHALARWMADNERPSCPADQMEEHIPALNALESAGWVVFDEPRAKVAFRHQSFFDFAFAQVFRESRMSLYEMVRDRPGLWIRRRAWNLLTYLRDADPPQYTREFDMIWSSAEVRHHIKYLLLDFIAQLSSPLAFEVSRMQEALRSTRLGKYAWKAVGRAGDWLAHLNTDSVAKGMADEHTAWRAFGLLHRAFPHRTDTILELVGKLWTEDPVKALPALHLLQDLPTLTLHARDVALRIAAVLGLRGDNYSIERMALRLVEFDPGLAFQVMGRAFETSIDRILARSDESIRAELEKMRERKTPLFSSSHRRPIEERDIDRRRRQEISYLIEELPVLVTFDTPVKQHPGLFLEYMIAPLLRGLAAASTGLVDAAGFEAMLDWPESSSEIEFTMIGHIAQAVGALAERAPDDFVEFLTSHCTSRFSPVHRLLLIGLEAAAVRRLSLIVEYFGQDPGRLAIGTTDQPAIGPLRLFMKIGDDLPPEHQRSLGVVVLRWDPPLGNENEALRDYRKTRFDEIKCALLRCFRRENLDTDARAFLDANADLMSPVERPRMRRGGRLMTYISRGDARERMTIETLKAASDDEILHAFATLPDFIDDTEDTDLPEGSLNAAHALAEFAGAEPTRGLRIARRFAPQTHERPVGMVLDAVAKSTSNEDGAILDFIADAELRGFRSIAFRDMAAQALRTIAERKAPGDGLPDTVCERLARWLDEASYSSGEPWTESAPERGDRPLYFDRPSGISLPHHSYSILSCLASGLLKRPEPAWDRWLQELTDHLARGDDFDVWRMFSYGSLGRVAAVLGSRSEPFFNRLIAQVPALLDGVEGLHLLDALQAYLDRGPSRAWIEALQRRGGEWHAQAYAELLVLRLWRLQDDPWAHDELATLVAAEPPYTENILAMRAGAALMIAHLMPDIPSESPLFCWLLALARGPTPASIAAIRQATWALMFEDCECSYMGDELLLFISINSVYVDSSTAGNIIRLMLRYVDRRPALVAEVARAVLERCKSSFMEHDELLGVIVAVHQMEGLRDLGLDLFEAACELDISGSGALLDEHNDLLEKPSRPATRPLPRKAPRRRKA